MQTVFIRLKKKAECSCAYLAYTLYCRYMKIQSNPSLASRIRDALINYNGVGFARLLSFTDARLRKTNNPNPLVYKLTDAQVNLGFHYINSLNAQAKREGKQVEFQVQPRPWGQRIEGTSLVRHVVNEEERLYLEAKVEKVFSTRYFTPEGLELTKDQVEPFLPKPKPSSTQAPLTKKIFLRDYRLDHILSIKFASQEIS
jgi:hypothetical protein